MTRPDRVAVGKVVGCHGLRGELKVEPLTDDPDRFGELDRVYLGDGDEAQALASYRVHKGRVLLCLEGVDGREAAEKLRGQVLTIPRGERRALPEDRWYVDDLVGLEARDGQGEVVGEVIRFDEQVGAGTLELRLATGGKLLVPFADAWVPEVDIEGGFVVLAPGWRQLR